MIDEMLVPIFIMLGLFAMIFGVVYVKARENMAMIEKGMNPKINKATPRPYVSLKYGLLMLGAGIGLFLAFLFDQFLLNHHAVTPGGSVYEQDFPQIYFALIAIFGGLGLIVSYRMEKKEWLSKVTEE
jgi:H+/Cl- antiporter ClcA